MLNQVLWKTQADTGPLRGAYQINLGAGSGKGKCLFLLSFAVSVLSHETFSPILPTAQVAPNLKAYRVCVRLVFHDTRTLETGKTAIAVVAAVTATSTVAGFSPDSVQKQTTQTQILVVRKYLRW